jgi:hypothetical protein
VLRLLLLLLLLLLNLANSLGLGAGGLVGALGRHGHDLAVNLRAILFTQKGERHRAGPTTVRGSP